MKSLKFSLAILVSIVMSSCSSIELTQSKYGNGIGISLQKNSEKETQKALAFRKRKHNEVVDKKFPLQNPISRSLNKVQFEDNIPELIAQENLNPDYTAPTRTPSNPSLKKTVLIQKTVNKIVDKQLKGVEKLAERLDKPSETDQTQNDLSNLAYLGGVLVIAGLILMLLGVNNGWSVLVLGVILIIVAYFFG